MSKTTILVCFLFLMVSLNAKGQNVGIGNTNPLEKLHVSGKIRSDSLAGIGVRTVFADPNGTLFDSLVIIPTSNDDWKLLGNAGTNPTTNFLGTTDNQHLVFRTNNTEKVRILTNGNVGIGTTTPTERLEIGNNGQFSLMAAPGTKDPGDIIFKNGDATLKARIWSEPSFNQGLLINGTGTAVPAIYVDSMDRVGIQTTTPAWPLEVATTGNRGHIWDSATVARFRNRSVGTCTYNRYWDWRVGNCGQLGLQTAPDNNNPFFNILNNGAIPSPGIVVSFNTSGPVNTLTTSGTGNVGIGLMNAAAKFHIYQNANNVEYIRLTNNATNDFSILFGSSFAGYNNAAGIVYHEIGGTETHMFGGEVIPDANGNAWWNLGNASKRWNTLFAVNGTINTSDAREKTNIKKLNYGLQEVLNLNPVSFNWKNPELGTQNKIGLLAQEVYKEIPEVVYVPKNENESWGLNYAELNAVLINAIKDQQKIIEEQKKQIEKLTHQQEAFAKELNYLKTKFEFSSEK